MKSPSKLVSDEALVCTEWLIEELDFNWPFFKSEVLLVNTGTISYSVWFPVTVISYQSEIDYYVKNQVIIMNIQILIYLLLNHLNHYFQQLLQLLSYLLTCTFQFSFYEIFYKRLHWKKYLIPLTSFVLAFVRFNFPFFPSVYIFDTFEGALLTKPRTRSNV